MSSLIQIGNSQGIRIPKAIIKQANLSGKELEFKIVENGLLIRSIKQPRKDWKEKFEKPFSSKSEDKFDTEWLNAPLSSEEDEEWEW